MCLTYSKFFWNFKPYIFIKFVLIKKSIKYKGIKVNDFLKFYLFSSYLQSAYKNHKNLKLL